MAWGDDWVTYTDRWGLTDSTYDAPVGYAQCAGHTARTTYSIPQFWYNVLRWAAPRVPGFTINVPATADPRQRVVQ